MKQLSLFIFPSGIIADIVLAWKELNRLVDDVLNYIGEGEW